MNGISELVVREELSVLPSGDGPQAVCERTEQNRNSDPCPVRGVPSAQMLKLGLFSPLPLAFRKELILRSLACLSTDLGLLSLHNHMSPFL